MGMKIHHGDTGHTRFIELDFLRELSVSVVMIFDRGESGGEAGNAGAKWV
jgi:hypothetical protein